MNEERTSEKRMDAGLQCLVTIASYYGIPVDAEGLVHSLGLEDRQMTAQDFVRAAKRVNFKSQITKVNIYALEKMTVPAVLMTKDDNFVILARIQQNKALALYPFEKAPRLLTFDELQEIWDGEIILLIPRNQKLRDVKFGFKWFIPSILKYKRPLLEVLLAALIMQILSICSPLVTQSVIDKVLVHVEFLTNQKENIAAALDYANTAQQNAEKLALEIQYMEEELADYQELYNAGAVSKAEVEAVELELAQLRVDYEIQKNQTVYEEYDNNLQSGDIENQLALAQKDVATQENAVLLANEQYELALDGMEALEAEFATNISGLIVENENRISALKTNLEIQTISVEQQTIVSPVDGIVKTLDINTVGGVLTMGQVVATVVPDDSQMMVEVDVLNQDIGCIQTGQSVVMKLDAFNFQEYGKLEGTIAFVGPDAVFDESRGWVYKVKIAIDDAAFVENNPEIQIGVGMECTTEIKVGERKIIEFFMEPIVEHFDGSLEVR